MKHIQTFETYLSESISPITLADVGDIAVVKRRSKNGKILLGKIVDFTKTGILLSNIVNDDLEKLSGSYGGGTINISPNDVIQLIKVK